MPPAKRDLQVLTLNVNGLGGPARAATLALYLARVARHPDVVMLQELKCADMQAFNQALDTISAFGICHYHQRYVSLGTDNSCGVAVLLKAGVFASAPTVATSADAEGRIVRVDVDVRQQKLSFVSVYAPQDQKTAFFASALPQHLPQPADRTIIMGGDFNCIMDADLDQTNDGQHRTEGSNALGVTVHNFNLHDALRYKHPAARVYTHVGTNRESAARLDRILVSSSCTNWVSRVRHVHGSPSDHAGVSVSMQLPGTPSLGPGLRCFPRYLLYDTNLVAQVRTRVEAYIAQHSTAPGIPTQSQPHADYDFWAALKDAILDIGITIAEQHGQRQRAAIALAQKAMDTAAHRLAQQPTSQPRLAEYRSAAEQLAAAVREQARKTSIALEVMWQDHGERCTAWHFDQALKHRSDGLISSLVDSSNVAHDLANVTSGLDLSNLVTEYYSSDSECGVFRPSATDPAAQARLLQHVRRRLTPQQATAADGPNGDGTITAACIMEALQGCANGKSAGRDGLQYEVYKVLAPVLLEPFVAAANDIFAHGAADTQWNEGVIVEIYKDGRDLRRDHLSSYRPITLLNCDNKIIQKIMVNRTKHALDYLIDQAQTAFVPGRDIGDNVLLQQCMWEQLVSIHGAGAIIFLDIKSAYDKVDRGWLIMCMQALGLPAGVIEWTRRFMEDNRSHVLINGWLTHDFPVNNGLMQGGPWAPSLWAIQLEPLVARLLHERDSGTLHTPILRDGLVAPPIACHADDCKLFVADVATDGPVAMACVSDYEAASGEKIEPAKSKGICMGSHASITGIDPVTQANFGQATDPPVKALGLPSTRDLSAARASVFERCNYRMMLAVEAWVRVPLSGVGRALNAKQLLASIWQYHLRFVGLDATQLDFVLQKIHRYTAQSPHPEDASLTRHGVPALLPKAGISQLTKDKGGMGVVDLVSYAASLRAKNMASLFSPGAAPWKAMLAAELTAAAPSPNMGPGWTLTALPMSLTSLASETVSDMVQAIRQVGVQPCVQPPESASVRGLLTFPLYYNAAIVDSAGQYFTLPTPVPPNWPQTVGQLAACTAADVSSSAQLQQIEAALPEAYAAALATARAGESALAALDEWWVNADNSVVVRRSPVSGEVFYVLHSGVLATGAARPAPQTLRPACILPTPKPKKDWTQAELDEYQTAPHAERHLHRPTSPRFYGAWQAIRVYPLCWQVARQPLHMYSSAATRLQLTAIAAGPALQEHMPQYQPGDAVRPRLWTDAARPQQSGLAYWEQRWREHNSRRRDFDVPPAPWMLSGPPQPRTTRTSMAARGPDVAQPAPPHLQAAAGPSTNSAAGAAAAVAAAPAAAPDMVAPAAAPGGDTSAKCWARLWAAPVSNRVKVLGYRLLHAALPCLAMHAHMQNWAAGRACCPNCPGAHGTTRSRPAETYTHVFCECPVYRPVMLWLLDTYAALQGVRPPEDPRVIIADELCHWPEAPAPGDAMQLWQGLRLIVLFQIWEARCSKDSSQRSPSAVARAAVTALRHEISLQFQRSRRRALMTQHLPARVLDMRRLEPRGDSLSVWLQSGLCSTSIRADGMEDLHLQLTEAWPVAVPGLEDQQ